MRLKFSFPHYCRWLTPGIGIKRWLIVILIGTTFIGLGFTFFALDIYRDTSIGWLERCSVDSISFYVSRAGCGHLFLGELALSFW